MFKAIGQIAIPKYSIIRRGQVTRGEQTARLSVNYLETQYYASGRKFQKRRVIVC